MNASRYGENGRCSAPACHGILVVHDGGQRLTAALREGLQRLGMKASFASQEEINCADATMHVAVCVFGWFTDYPDAGNMFVWLLSTDRFKERFSLLGSTPQQLDEWGYRNRRVPSIDEDYERCAAQLGVRAALCWARLDQLVVGELAAVLPLASPEAIRLEGSNVTAFSLDQAFAEPALDRLATSR